VKKPDPSTQPAAASERVRRTREAPAERRAAILDAAAKVVTARGLADTRVGDVANEIGVSHGLVHYYFPDKDDLIAATMRHAADADAAALIEAVASVPDATAKLDLFLVSSIPTPQTRATWALWVDAWAEALRHESVRSVHEDLDAAWTGLLEQVLRDGVETGEFDCLDPAASAARISALIDGLCLRLELRNRGITATEVLSLLRTQAAFEVGRPVAH
jgi:AcrR family transcriptional regulator